MRNTPSGQLLLERPFLFLTDAASLQRESCLETIAEQAFFPKARRVLFPEPQRGRSLDREIVELRCVPACTHSRHSLLVTRIGNIRYQGAVNTYLDCRPSEGQGEMVPGVQLT
jgi:hypothetical protein